jgi:hypothetical protein
MLRAKRVVFAQYYSDCHQQKSDEQNEYDYKLVHFISNYFAKILIFID